MYKNEEIVGQAIAECIKAQLTIIIGPSLDVQIIEGGSVVQYRRPFPLK